MLPQTILVVISFALCISSAPISSPGAVEGGLTIPTSQREAHPKSIIRRGNEPVARDTAVASSLETRHGGARNSYKREAIPLRYGNGHKREAIPLRYGNGHKREAIPVRYGNDRVGQVDGNTSQRM